MWFTACDIQNARIVMSKRNVALPVVCLQDDQQNSKNDDDTYDNDGDHSPRTLETQKDE